MIRRLLHAGLSLLGLAVVAYVWLFVPLGRRTLHEHALRIADTEPAHELGDEAEEATRRLGEHVRAAWESRYGDGGVPFAPGP